jgi:hypothetical protein
MARYSRPNSTIITAKNLDGGTQKWLPGPNVNSFQPPPPKPQIITTNAGSERQFTYSTAVPVLVESRTPQINGNVIQSYNRTDGGAAVVTTTAQPVVVQQRAPIPQRVQVTGSAAPAEVYMGPIYIVPAIPQPPIKYMRFSHNEPTDTVVEVTPVVKPVIVTMQPPTPKVMSFITNEPTDAPIILRNYIVTQERNRLTPGRFIKWQGDPAAAPPVVGPDAPLICGRTGAFGIDRDTGVAGIARITAVVGIDRDTGVAGVGRTSGVGGFSRGSDTSALNTRLTDVTGSTRTTDSEDPC